MTEYTLKMPPAVACGPGVGQKVVQAVAAQSPQSLVVVVDRGVKKSGSVDEMLHGLRNCVKTFYIDEDIPPEPAVQDVLDAYERMRRREAGLVVAVGGGSVMDTAKLLAVLLENPGFADDITDTGRIARRGAPLYMVPTSAGTGAEATPNAIVRIPEKKVKQGVVHDYFIPDRVFLDPLLTRTMPPHVTAATGLDAFCHCLETYISKKSSPFSALFSLEGMRLISASLRKAYENGEDMRAREDMLLAAFYGGVAITASSTVAVHALSYPLGGSYHIPHGVSNAILLPHVMAFNMPAIGPKLPAIAGAMGLDTRGKTEEQLGGEVSKEIFDLCADLQIPDSLRGYSITDGDLGFLVGAAKGVRRLLDQNPREMQEQDIEMIYRKLV